MKRKELDEGAKSLIFLNITLKMLEI